MQAYSSKGKDHALDGTVEVVRMRKLKVVQIKTMNKEKIKQAKLILPNYTVTAL